MIHRTYKLAALLVALALFGGAVVACDKVGVGSPYLCDTRLSAPVISEEIADNYAIDAVATATCDASPDTHVIQLWIERENAGPVWATWGNADADWGTTHEVPRPGSPVVFHWYVIPCKSGHYRTRALVTGTGHDGRSFSFSVPEMPDATINCPLDQS